MNNLERMLTPERLAELVPWSAYSIRQLAKRRLIRSHQIHQGKRGAKIRLLYSEFLADTECPMAPSQEFMRRCNARLRAG